MTKCKHWAERPSKTCGCSAEGDPSPPGRERGAHETAQGA